MEKFSKICISMKNLTSASVSNDKTTCYFKKFCCCYMLPYFHKKQIILEKIKNEIFYNIFKNGKKF